VVVGTCVVVGDVVGTVGTEVLEVEVTVVEVVAGVDGVPQDNSIIDSTRKMHNTDQVTLFLIHSLFLKLGIV